MYWLERHQNNVYKNDVAKFEKQLAKVYKQAFKTIDSQLKDIFLDMLGGEISQSALLQNNRLTSIMNVVDKELRKLGVEMNSNLQQTLLDVYKSTYLETTNFLSPSVKAEFGLLQEQVAKEVVNASYKNAKYSDRVWNNLSTIRTQIEQKITNVAIAGQDYKKASRELRDRMGVSLSDSSRIVRTETSRVLNESCRNTAIERGYTSYHLLIESDACDDCKALEHETFDIGNSIVPVHPHCKCCVVIDV